MQIALVAAIAENNVIGDKQKLPWRLKGELKLFADITRYHAIIMGRKTYDSLPKKPLPDRLNIIISRNKNNTENHPLLAYCTNVDQALALANEWDQKQAETSGNSPKKVAMVIGGAEIYRLFFPLADIFYQTLVKARPMGDTYFSKVDPLEWQATELLADVASEIPSEQSKNTTKSQNFNINYSGYICQKWIRKSKK